MNGAEGNLAHTIWLIVHLVLFAYWLGGDIGVFYSTRMILNRSNTPDQRFMASRIMLWIDLLPRLCLSMMLTVGGILSEYVGVSHPPWQYAMIVVLGPVWFTVLLVMHFKHNASFMPMLTKLDLWFRWFLIVAIVASVWWSLSTGRLDDAPWLAFKLIVFAIMILCGVMIRIYIPGFIAGVRALWPGLDYHGAGRRDEAQHPSRAPVGVHDLGRFDSGGLPRNLQARRTGKRRRPSATSCMRFRALPPRCSDSQCHNLNCRASLRRICRSISGMVGNGPWPLRGDATWFEVMAHAPELYDWYGEFYARLFRAGRVERVIKELTRLRLSTTHGCRFCNQGNRPGRAASRSEPGTNRQAARVRKRPVLRARAGRPRARRSNGFDQSIRCA